jgi:hypothetical protein
MVNERKSFAVAVVCLLLGCFSFLFCIGIGLGWLAGNMAICLEWIWTLGLGFWGWEIRIGIGRVRGYGLS